MNTEKKEYKTINELLGKWPKKEKPEKCIMTVTQVKKLWQILIYYVT